MRDFFKTFAAAWKPVAHAIGNFQARLLLSIFYVAVMSVFALIVKAFNDPLQLKRRERTSGWTDRPETSANEGMRSLY